MNRNMLTEFTQAMDERPGLSGILGLHRDILQVQLVVADRQPPFPLPANSKVVALLQEGKPIATWVPIEVEFSDFARCFRHISRVVMKHKPELQNKVQDLLSVDWDFPALVRAFWDNQLEQLLQIARSRAVDEKIFSFLFSETLKPFYFSYADNLCEVVPQEQWQKPYCPVCGGSPMMARLKGPSGERWLTCSFCGTEWLHRRAECPLCGAGPDVTHFVVVEDEPAYGFDLCDSCRGYLKFVDLRVAEKERNLYLEHLLSLHIDFMVQQMGYSNSVPQGL